jgi:hypothetical protein
MVAVDPKTKRVAARARPTAASSGSDALRRKSARPLSAEG